VMLIQLRFNWVVSCDSVDPVDPDDPVDPVVIPVGMKDI
jgi:hypothetical protein